MSTVNLKAWFEARAKNAGIEWTDELEKAAQSGNIPAEVAGQLETSYITLEAAQNHPDIRKAALGAKLGGLDTWAWKQARDVHGLDRETYSKIRGEYNPETNRFEGSIADKLPAILSYFEELAEKRGESKVGVSTDEIRAQVEAKIKAEYEGKLSANSKTISGHTSKIQELQEALDKKDREFNKRLEESQRNSWLQNQYQKFVPKLKPELAKYSDMLVKAKMEKLLGEYVIKWHDESKTYQAFDKTDPSARALDANKVFDLTERIAADFAEEINPNPPSGGGGGGSPTFTPTKTTTGNGKPKVPGGSLL